MAEQVFRPGEQVSESGIYRVSHIEHRPEHEVTLFEGEEFPSCVRCGKGVRFQLERSANAIQHDRDFKVKRARRKTAGRH